MTTHALIQWLHKRFKRSFVYALVLSMIILLGGGIGFWILDPAIATLGDGVWLAFTTAATVGYGDLVPTTFASRLFSVFVFLLGLAVLSLATAALTVALTPSEPPAEIPAQRHCSDPQLLEELRILQAQVRQLQTELHTIKDRWPERPF